MENYWYDVEETHWCNYTDMFNLMNTFVLARRVCLEWWKRKMETGAPWRGFMPEEKKNILGVLEGLIDQMHS